VEIRIETQRLIIRPLLLSDAHDYFDAEMASVKEMAPYWSWVNSNKSLQDIKDFLTDAYLAHQKPQPSNMYFAICDKSNNKILGCVWFFIQWTVPRLEIAYFLDSRHTGHGYMTEAVHALTKFAFEQLKMHRVEIKTFVTNSKSQSIPKRLGFQLEGTLKNYFIDFVTSEIIDGYVYACTQPFSGIY